MNFNDIIKKSFLEQFNSNDLSIDSIILTLFITTAIGIYLFFAYGALSNKSFYSKNFATSLPAIAIIIASIIMTIKSSFIISLGMVGALSIVRFRTPVKEPLDLIFLFWAIAVGIICGANYYAIAIIASLFVTIITIFLNILKTNNKKSLLFINFSTLNIEKQIVEIIKENTKSYEICSKNKSLSTIEYIIEINTKDENKLLSELSKFNEITSINILNQDIN